MPNYEDKLTSMDLVLPQPLKLPPGMILPFPWVNVEQETELDWRNSEQCLYFRDGFVISFFIDDEGEVEWDIQFA